MPKKTNLTPFARKLKVARLKMGMSMQKAAKLAGVQLNSWWRWESGKHMPRMELLAKIAKALKIQPEDLV